MNDTVAHQVAAKIVSICEQYPGCVLLFERLRKMKPGAMSQSRRLNHTSEGVCGGGGVV